MPDKTLAKKVLEIFGIITPMVPLLLLFKFTATGFGRYLCNFASSFTRSTVLGLISGLSFRALETVETDTLSNFASSFKVILFFIYFLFNPAEGIYHRLIII